MKECDFREVTYFITSICPQMKPKFDCLNTSNIKKVITSIEFGVFEKDELIFKQWAKGDYAYLILFGHIGFIKSKSQGDTVGSDDLCSHHCGDHELSKESMSRDKLQKSPDRIPSRNSNNNSQRGAASGMLIQSQSNRSNESRRANSKMDDNPNAAS